MKNHDEQYHYEKQIQELTQELNDTKKALQRTISIAEDVCTHPWANEWIIGKIPESLKLRIKDLRMIISEYGKI